MLDALGHAGLRRARLAQVADVAADAVQLLERLGAAPGREHARALGDAQLRDRAADARGRAGDEDAPALELALDRASERVALVHVAALEAGREPALALRGGAVRPLVGVDLALRLALDAVVADRRRGAQGVVDLRLGDRLEQARLGRVRRPHAGEAVGLQLACAPTCRSRPRCCCRLSRMPSRSWT